MIGETVGGWETEWGYMETLCIFAQFFLKPKKKMSTNQKKKKRKEEEMGGACFSYGGIPKSPISRRVGP